MKFLALGPPPFYYFILVLHTPNLQNGRDIIPPITVCKFLSKTKNLLCTEYRLQPSPGIKSNKGSICWPVNTQQKQFITRALKSRTVLVNTAFQVKQNTACILQEFFYCHSRTMTHINIFTVIGMLWIKILFKGRFSSKTPLNYPQKNSTSINVNINLQECFQSG